MIGAGKVAWGNIRSGRKRSVDMLRRRFSKDTPAYASQDKEVDDLKKLSDDPKFKDFDEATK